LPPTIEGDRDALLDSMHEARDGAAHPYQHRARRQHIADGERTVLAFVGDGQTIEVTETPEQILERHFGPMAKA